MCLSLCLTGEMCFPTGLLSCEALPKMKHAVVLTDEELLSIREALDYAVQRVRDYPHQEYSHKMESLRPIESARLKVRQMIAKRKESTCAH